MLKIGTMISTNVVYCKMSLASLYSGFCHVVDSKGEHKLGCANKRPYSCIRAKALLIVWLV